MKNKILTLCLIIATMSTTACGITVGSSVSETPTETETESTTSDTAQESEVDTTEELVIVEVGVNPLTGEKNTEIGSEQNRPVAVMVNNLKQALPQYGVADADIIYEVPVEGGITRLMAIYSDYKNVPNICSVRSCRYYYPLIALGYDAVYCHWGADQTIALDTLYRTGIANLDGGSGGPFYRDSVRAESYSSEHTGYMAGAELPQYFDSFGYRTTVNNENYGGGLNFNESNEDVKFSQSCNSITLNFSGEYYSTFDYNADEGTYYKYHSGSPHMDSVEGTQLEFENVFVIQTYISTRSDGYLMDVDVVGSGTGYYATKGSVSAITWAKETENSPIRIYDENSQEMAINIGESYFGIIGTEKNIEISE